MKKMLKPTKMIRRIAIILVLLVLKPDIVNAQIFSRVDHPIFKSTDNISFGKGFFDYNNDGKLDIYISTSAKNKAKLFRNNGNDDFTEIFDDNLLPGIQYTHGITIGDYDNDGLKDLFLCSMSGNNSLIHNEGDGKYLRSTNPSWTKDGGFQVHCSWVDYDNDGLLDLFIPVSDGASFVKGTGSNNYLYHNGNDGIFKKVDVSEPENVHGNNVSANFCDFDNDGDMDLFMTECQMNNHLFENVNGEFKEINKEFFTNTNSSLSCSWGDYDNDGYMDLFVTNGFPGNNGKYPNYLYHNNGDKTFTQITTGELLEYTGNSWHSLWADFDNDGDLDLFLGTVYFPDQLYLNDGKGNFTMTEEFDSTTTGTSGACFGDYNNDGFLDLYSGYTLTPDSKLLSGNVLYKNKGNGNNWLLVDCEGSVSNRSAIGARVKVKANIFGRSYWQIRDINGTMGLRSANDLKAHFGLGDASVIDSLIIEWPSKQKTVMTNVQINQTLKIKEEIPLNYLKSYFKADKISGYSPLQVQFTDYSVFDERNPITSWSWDFDGDGKEDSNEKNPVFTFNTYEEKDYPVSLIISNGSKTDTVTKINYIKVFALSQQNIAQNKIAAANSEFSSNYSAQKAIDGSPFTHWESTASDSQWIQIELDSLYSIGQIVINWGTYYAKKYSIIYSDDGTNWIEMMNIEDGKGKKEEYFIAPIKAKYIKLNMTERSSVNKGYRIIELEIYRPAVTEVKETELTPTGFNLFQNYPNPFNPVTVIGYRLSASLNPSQGGTSVPVALKVYDILGCEVAILVNEEQKPGTYQVKFNGSSLSSGIYFYTLTAGEYSQTRKLVLLR